VTCGWEREGHTEKGKGEKLDPWEVGGKRGHGRREGVGIVGEEKVMLA